MKKFTKGFLWAVGLGMVVQPSLSKTDASVWSAISGLYSQVKEKLTHWGSSLEDAAANFGKDSLMLDYNNNLVTEYQAKYNKQTAKKGDSFVEAMSAHKKAHDQLHLAMLTEHESNISGANVANASDPTEQEKHAYNKANHEALRDGHLKDFKVNNDNFLALKKKWEDLYKDQFPDPHGFYTSTEHSTVAKPAVKK